MSSVIRRNLDLDWPRGRVWQAITDPEQLQSWFPDRAALEREAGGEGWFEWDSHGRFAARVELYEPPSRISWRWVRDPGTAIDSGPSTLVEWALFPTGTGGTRLVLTESGFEREADRRQNEKDWTKELGELQSFLALGVGAGQGKVVPESGATQRVPTLQRAGAICRSCGRPIVRGSDTCSQCGAPAPE